MLGHYTIHIRLELIPTLVVGLDKVEGDTILGRRLIQANRIAKKRHTRGQYGRFTPGIYQRFRKSNGTCSNSQCMICKKDGYKDKGINKRKWINNINERR